MLSFRNLFPSPRVITHIDRLKTETSGLVIVAGLEARPETELLPSGRQSVFRSLLDDLIGASQGARWMMITADPGLLRARSSQKSRPQFLVVDQKNSYLDRLQEAMPHRLNLLALDNLEAEMLPAVFKAVHQGVRVIAQFDTPFRGPAVLRELGLEPSPGVGGVLTPPPCPVWVITVRRVPRLCSSCREAAPFLPEQLAQIAPVLNHLPDLAAARFYHSLGCAECNHKARSGDVAILDIYRQGAGEHLSGEHLLPMEREALDLALQGSLSLADWIDLDESLYRVVYRLLCGHERTHQVNLARLERLQAELEAANRVLQQRTQALFSLEDISQTLIGSTSLGDLAGKICRRARDLCGADKAILYLLRPDTQAQVLAVNGWDWTFVQPILPGEAVFGLGRALHLRHDDRWPPGVDRQALYGTGEELHAGLSVPLLAQERMIGLMVVHSMRKDRFAPGESALLQTFANQAALALQRSELVEQLQDKIAQLESAQAELVKKERMESELALARQVQQSMLPQTFPPTPGYHLSAHYEPARQVGGDFYDVIPLDADHFGIAIADVSDKGMPAALYMSLTRSLLLAEARRERSPRAALSNVNQLLLELGKQNTFVTLFYGVIEVSSRKFTYARAGHDRPIWLHEGSLYELDGQGMLLGMFDQDEFRLAEAQIVLHPGDRLILYTDGLTELMSSENRPSGLAFLKTTISAHASLQPAELCQAIFADLASYQGPASQFDDMTLLVLSVA